MGACRARLAEAPNRALYAGADGPRRDRLHETQAALPGMPGGARLRGAARRSRRRAASAAQAPSAAAEGGAVAGAAPERRRAARAPALERHLGRAVVLSRIRRPCAGGREAARADPARFYALLAAYLPAAPENGGRG